MVIMIKVTQLNDWYFASITLTKLVEGHLDSVHMLIIHELLFGFFLGNRHSPSTEKFLQSVTI